MSNSTPVLKTILWHSHKKLWKLQCRKMTEKISLKVSFSKSAKLTAETKDRTSTNHLILQPDTEWRIWHVLAVYQSFLQVYTASSSGHSCSLTLFPTHLKQLIKPIAKIQLLQIHTDCKCICVTLNTNLCFLIRGLRLVNQPWHQPDLTHWVTDFPAKQRRQMSIHLRWSHHSSQKKPLETSRQTNNPPKPGCFSLV